MPVRNIGGTVQVTGRTVETTLTTYTKSTSLAAGDSETTNITAGTGKRGVIKAVYFSVAAPSSATSGTHQVFWSYDTNLVVALGRSAFGDNIEYNYSNWQKATSLQIPDGITAEGQVLKGLPFTDSQPLILNYANNTDVPQTGTRTLKVLVELEPVV